jgi:hypothetical protein
MMGRRVAMPGGIGVPGGQADQQVTASSASASLSGPVAGILPGHSNA